MHRFIIVNRDNPSKSIVADCSDEVGFFLKGKNRSDWIVVRDGMSIVHDEIVQLSGTTQGEIAASCRRK